MYRIQSYSKQHALCPIDLKSQNTNFSFYALEHTQDRSRFSIQKIRSRQWANGLSPCGPYASGSVQLPSC